MDNKKEPVTYSVETQIFSEHTFIKWKFKDIAKVFKTGSSPCEGLINSSTMEFTTEGKISGHSATWKLGLVYDKSTNSLHLKAVPLKYHGLHFPQNGYHAAMEIIDAEGLNAVGQKSSLAYLKETQGFPQVETNQATQGTQNHWAQQNVANIIRPALLRLPITAMPPIVWQSNSQFSLYLTQCTDEFYSTLDRNHGSFSLLIKFSQLSVSTAKVDEPINKIDSIEHQPLNNPNSSRPEESVNETTNNEGKDKAISADLIVKDPIKPLEGENEHEILKKKPKLN